MNNTEKIINLIFNDLQNLKGISSAYSSKNKITLLMNSGRVYEIDVRLRK